ncbi:MAG: 3'-5' exonuclease domain-containing protein 2 [Prevotella sp.]|nr:3'-5' exonuclease domain-containing protein 2 [Prevotella sp.]
MKKLIFNKVNKDSLADLPKVTFPGKIVVVVSREEAERCVDYLLQQDVLGFDTETRPAFAKGTHYKCSLLQVASQDCCFLFRLNYTGLTPDIIRLLEATSIKKVGLAWRNDILALKELGDFEAAGFIDLQDMVKAIGIEDQSLVKIFANLFQQRISKSERLSNWERDVLKDSQKNYAAIDAWACVLIYRELVRLNETGDYRLEIVEEPKPYENNIS